MRKNQDQKGSGRSMLETVRETSCSKRQGWSKKIGGFYSLSREEGDAQKIILSQKHLGGQASLSSWKGGSWVSMSKIVRMTRTNNCFIPNRWPAPSRLILFIKDFSTVCSCLEHASHTLSCHPIAEGVCLSPVHISQDYFYLTIDSHDQGVVRKLGMNFDLKQIN